MDLPILNIVVILLCILLFLWLAYVLWGGFGADT